MDKIDQGKADVQDVDGQSHDVKDDDLDDDSLEFVAGGTDWLPEKDDRKRPPSWDSPERW